MLALERESLVFAPDEKRTATSELKMTEVTAFKLDSGAVVHVQSSVGAAFAPARRGATRSGSPISNAITGLAEQTWSDQLALVREVTAGIVEKLSGAAPNADQIELEFGVDLHVEGSVGIVSGTGTANLKVKISWTPAAD